MTKMTNSKGSKISRGASHGLVRDGRLVIGSEKNDGGGLPGGSSSPSSTPVPVLDGGRIVLPGAARRARTVRLPLAMPPRVVAAWLTVPAVLDEIEFQRRFAIVRAVAVMKAAGVSQNKAADSFGIPRSLLSVWLNAFAAGGEDALRPMSWNAGRQPAQGKPKRHSAFIELKVR